MTVKRDANPSVQDNHWDAPLPAAQDFHTFDVGAVRQRMVNIAKSIRQKKLFRPIADASRGSGIEINVRQQDPTPQSNLKGFGGSRDRYLIANEVG